MVEEGFEARRGVQRREKTSAPQYQPNNIFLRGFGGLHQHAGGLIRGIRDGGEGRMRESRGPIGGRGRG